MTIDPNDPWLTVHNGDDASDPRTPANPPHVADSTPEALRCFRERVDTFIEIANQEYEQDDPPTDWAAVITREAAIIVQEGPDAYRRYVDDLDRRAIRADLDRHLALILGGEPE